jgi:hypothetical protein
MKGSRAPLLARFVVLDGIGVGAVLLDDGLGGGWAADVLAIAIVLVGIVVVVRITAQYLDMVDNPAPEEQSGEPDARAWTNPVRGLRDATARRAGGHDAS